jgi:hypothetical protein
MILLSGLFILGITAIESKLYIEDVSAQKRLWEQYKQDPREYRRLEEMVGSKLESRVILVLLDSST